MAEFYGTWKEDIYFCDKCGWKGTGEDCTQGEIFNDLYEIDCPSCCKRVDVVLYPTIEESRANWGKVSNADKAMIEAREQFIKEAESRCLESPEELPEVEGDNLFFVWDQQKDYMVISYGKEIIWREPAFYEGYSRFEEVAMILKKKYGAKLKDLAPAQRSQNYLLGDSFSAAGTVQSIRNCLELNEWQGLPTKNSRHRTIVDWSQVVIENPNINKVGFSDSRRSHDLSKLPRLHLTRQLPEIHSDDDLIFIWDEQEADPISQIVIRYGNTVIWKEFSYYECYNRFEPIAMLLQGKYGKRVKDLIPTPRSEINLYGDCNQAGNIVGAVQGNLWMSQYNMDVGVITEETDNNNSGKTNSHNTKSSATASPSTVSNSSKDIKSGYTIYVEEDYWFQDDPELLSAGKVIYVTYEDAVRECKKMIDDLLIQIYKPEMRVDELYDSYLRLSDEPHIIPRGNNNQFLHSKYAEEQCVKICR